MITDFDKRKIFLFLILLCAFSLFSNFLFNFLSVYTEKTSFIWNEISKRKVPQKKINLLILGDSQITSGIHPDLLRNEIRKSNQNFDLFYYPRPSEQPEGILILTRKFSKEFAFDYLLVNISPVTTSKNLIAESHKSLFQNFSNFSLEPFTDLSIGKYYFNNFSGGLYYVILQAFPLLKLNSNFTREFAIVSENESLIKDDLEKKISVPLFAGFQKNNSQNIFLKKHFKVSEFYWEWGNFSDSSPKCIPQKKTPHLPPGVEVALLKIREDALKSWKKIAMESKSKKAIFLYLPFSPASEEKIGSTLPNSPIQVSLNALKNFNNVEILTPPENFFNSEDYADYTHLNACGMLKLNRFLSDYFFKLGNFSEK